jgi:hypothetical protein
MRKLWLWQWMWNYQSINMLCWDQKQKVET